jgi:hypothetical protein
MFRENPGRRQLVHTEKGGDCVTGGLGRYHIKVRRRTLVKPLNLHQGVSE